MNGKFLERFLLIFYLSLSFPLLASSVKSAATADTTFIEQQTKIQNDMEVRIKKILDHILGKNKSEVIVSVELEVKSEVTEQEASTGQRQQTSRFTNDSFILPGLPNPKSVTGGDRPTEESTAKSQKGALTYRYFLDIKKMTITVLYDKRIARSLVTRVENAIRDSLKLKDTDTLDFVKAEFSNPWSGWMELLSPLRLLLIVLTLTFLFFLFGPVASFLKNLVRTLRDRGGTEVSVDSKFENAPGENGEEKAGGAGGALSQAELEKKEEEEKRYKPFRFINEENLKRLIYLLRKESPEIIALVISYLKPELVKEILTSLPAEQQAQVALNMATIRQMTQDQVIKIDSTIKERIDFLVGGLDSLLKVLDEVDYHSRENILNYLKMEKPQLYEKVKKATISFDDIPNFPNQSLQIILRELKTESLAKALRGASREITDKVFTNMSTGAVSLLKEEIEYGRALTDDQIEDERRKIIEVIKNLERDGKIAIRDRQLNNLLEGEEEIPGSIWEGIAGEAVVPSSSNPEFPSYFQAGVDAYQNRQFEEAIQYFNYCLQINPDSWETYQYLGTVYYELGYTDQAFEAFQAALQINPNDENLQSWVSSLGVRP
ncbi:MAG: tetratricopeptide repeat protein [bacterium]